MIRCHLRGRDHPLTKALNNKRVEVEFMSNIQHIDIRAKVLTHRVKWMLHGLRYFHLVLDQDRELMAQAL